MKEAPIESIADGVRARQVRKLPTTIGVLLGSRFPTTPPQPIPPYCIPPSSNPVRLRVSNSTKRQRGALGLSSRRQAPPGRAGAIPVHGPSYDCNDESLPIGASFRATLVEQELARR